MGKQPRNRDWPGCEIMADQMVGYKVYRAMDMAVKTVKRKTFRPKKIYDIY
jgi:hypothetical protein